MTTTKKNQQKPIRLTLDQATRIVFLVDDLAGFRLTASERAVMEPLVWQIQLVHAEIEAEFHPGTPARDVPIRQHPGP
jgi:hypothetical protein